LNTGSRGAPTRSGETAHPNVPDGVTSRTIDPRDESHAVPALTLAALQDRYNALNESRAGAGSDSRGTTTVHALIAAPQS
jgi:hypothetical protein